MPQQPIVVWDEAQQKFRYLNAGEAPPQTGPQLPFAPPQTEQARPMNLDSIEPRDVTKLMLNLGGARAGLMPGAGAGMTAARIGVPALLRATGEAVGGGDFTDAATKEMTLGGLAEGGARSIPVIGNAMALASGGALNRFKSGFWPTVNAFTRQADRYFQPNPVGRTEPFTRFPWMERLLPSSRTAKNAAGAAVERAERANPTQVSVSEVMGTPTGGRRVAGGPNEAFADKAVNTDRGVSLPGKINQYDFDTLKETAIAQNGWEIKKFNATVRQVAELYDIPPHEAQTMVIEALATRAKLDVRTMGEMKRSLTARNPVVNARRNQEMVPADDETIKQARLNLANKLNEKRLSGDTDSRSWWQRFKDTDQGGDIARADRQFSDAAIMHDANKALRSGTPLGDLSLIASRGALGGILGSMTGVGGPTGTLLGLLALNPLALSTASTWGARSVIPGLAVYRGNKDVQDVRRRKPGDK